MIARFALELAPLGRCSHIVFVDDDRMNFPGSMGHEAQARDAWRLTSQEPGVMVPSVTMVAWPAGEGEGGQGLDYNSMQGISAVVMGR